LSDNNRSRSNDEDGFDVVPSWQFLL
jgi:hypothetical protein